MFYELLQAPDKEHAIKRFIVHKIYNGRNKEWK